MSNTVNEDESIAMIDKSTVDTFNLSASSRRDTERWISRQALSADAKVILEQIARLTAKVGDVVLRVGVLVMDAVKFVVNNAPLAATGLIIGAVIGALLGAVPLIGGVLGAFFTPLLAALGLGLGAISDLKDHNLERQIKEVVSRLDPLKAATI